MQRAKKAFHLLMRFLNIGLPMYFLLSVCALLLFGAVVFGWVVQDVARGIPRGGALGQIALQIAKYPEVIRSVINTATTELIGYNRAIVADYDPASSLGFEPINSLEGFEILGPQQRFSADRAAGWRVIVGVFNINGVPQAAAMALDPDMEVKHVWRLHEQGVEHPDARKRLYKFPHGFELLPDGSVIFTFEGGVSIRRLDVCGEEVWSDVGLYHHSVALSDSARSLWTLRHGAFPVQLAEDSSLVEIAVENGKIEREINFAELMAANPNIDIIGVRQSDLKGQSIWTEDPIHANDVDPLPADWAAAYPLFKEGDLLVSARALNLIFVVDPESKKIKWYRFGATRRQHDPDWNRRGTFTVFDNNMHRDKSRVVEVDPNTYETNVLVSGSKYNLYSYRRGKHQLLPNGSILVASPEQGRVLEIARSGKVDYEFINFRSTEASEEFAVSEALWVPEDFFEFDAFPQCPNN